MLRLVQEVSILLLMNGDLKRFAGNRKDCVKFPAAALGCVRRLHASFKTSSSDNL